jgi:hypothetical protein
MALFYGVIGGAMMVHTGGVDFVVLRPPLLAVVLFVSICGGFGAVVARLVNAASRADAWPQSRSRWLLGPPLLLLVFPPFLVVAIGALAVNWEDRAAGHSPVIWNALNAGAATVMSGLFVLGAVDLARDIAGLT